MLMLQQFVYNSQLFVYNIQSWKWNTLYFDVSSLIAPCQSFFVILANSCSDIVLTFLMVPKTFRRLVPRLNLAHTLSIELSSG